MTTILVTGATGQVGRRFVPRLLQWDGRKLLRMGNPVADVGHCLDRLTRLDLPGRGPLASRDVQHLSF
ncbi:hypothetical protein GCM10009753_21640 [Streptantibioticus ferralitis]